MRSLLFRLALSSLVVGALCVILLRPDHRAEPIPVLKALPADPTPKLESPISTALPSAEASTTAETVKPDFQQSSPAPAPALSPVRKLWAFAPGANGAPQSAGGEMLEVDPASLQVLGALAVGDPVSIPLPGGRVAQGVVHLVLDDAQQWKRIGGTLEGGGEFSLGTNGKAAGGLIQFRAARKAFELQHADDGRFLLVARPLSEVVCLPLPRPPPQTSTRATRGGPVTNPPILSSRPSAMHVLYLDFDGETVTDPLWDEGRTIVAPAARLSNAEVTEVFNRVREDFLAFNIDVTTNVSRYNSAAVGRRMRCIITRNDAAAPGAGGVAYLNSFDRLGSGGFSSTLPCWVFIDDNAKFCADATAHELGHTMGLRHDGRNTPVEEYFEGHGSGVTGWAPIMGVGYSRQLVHWSKGEYASANTQQDDIAIIANNANGFGFATDEAGGTVASAAPLNAPAGSVNQSGVIAQASDTDVYSFTTGGGVLNLTASPAAVDPNVDILLELITATGLVLASDNPVNTLGAAINRSMEAGTYYVRVRGTGKGNPLTDGYTAYGCMGAYTLTGTISTALQVPGITSSSNASGTVGMPFSFQVTATNNPTAFSLTDGSFPTGIVLNSAGVISGTPMVSGTFDVTLSATNAQGSGMQAFRLTVAPAAISVAEALDQAVRIFQLSGNANWFGQSSITFDGIDAARSGDIDDNQSSTIETTIIGPGTVSFRWRVESESGFDFLRVSLDGQVQASISGNTAWETRSLTLPTGSHVVRWSYTKDVSLSEGADSGFLDALTINAVQRPSISSATSVPGTVGQSFSYQIAATNSPTSFSLSGTLPGGLVFSSTTGRITGTPTVAGAFMVTIGAINAAGTGTAMLAINVSGAIIPLDAALDAPGRLFTTGGDAAWFGQNDTTNDGADAAHSGVIGANQQSFMETVVTGPATATFRWSVDSQEGFDFLRVLLDGVAQAQISGAIEFTHLSVAIPPGNHTIRWVYNKDGAVTMGRDSGWVDAFAVTGTAPPVITSDAVASGTVGEQFNYQITASNGPTSFSIVGTLPPGLVFNASTGLISGTFTQEGIYMLDVLASNIAGPGAPLTLTITVAPGSLTLAEALDGAGLVWSTTGDQVWVAQRMVTHDGIDAAQAGGLVDEEQSNLSTTVIGPAVLSFQWKVDSELRWDPLIFFIDGVESSRISGDQDWQRVEIVLGPGAHTLLWRYAKDESLSIGADAAWLDEVNVSPLTTLSGADTFAMAPPLGGALVSLQGNNTGATREAGEPLHNGQETSSSLWWSWTPTRSGTVSINTALSTFDTVLAVYTGDTVATLLPVASADRFRTSQQAAVKLRVTAGTTYRIAVSGAGGISSGGVQLTISYVPSLIFTGLLQADSEAAPHGIITFSVADGLLLRGSVRVGTQRGTFTGRLAEGTLQRVSGIPFTGAFTASLQSGTDQISGTLSAGGLPYSFVARTTLPKENIPLGVPGAYTFVLLPQGQPDGLPGGTGFARLLVKSNGSLKASGVLGDGKKFSASGPLQTGHVWTMFGTDTDGGSVGADIAFVEEDQTIAAVARWHKTPKASRRLFADGFTLHSDLRGGLYVPPSQVEPLFSVSQARVSFAGDDSIVLPEERSVTIDALGRFTIPRDAGLQLKFTARTGLFSGKTRDPVTNRMVPFAGTTISLFDFGAGTIQLPTGTGSVILDGGPGSSGLQ